jgi:Ca2+-binding RTX toxin-like protein
VRRFLVSLLAACGLLVALPAVASAWTASVSFGTLTVIADNAVVHDGITITDNGANIRVVNTVSGASAGPGCNLISTTTVDCPEAGISRIEAFGRDGDDVITISGSGFNTITSTFNTLNGQNGDDTLSGSASFSGAMGDEIFGGSGDDTLSGGTDDDTLDGGFGADTMSGGSGFDDEVEYGSFSSLNAGSGRYEDLAVSIGDGPNDGSLLDGPIDARDNVLGDVENLTGGSGDDVLIGEPFANELNGLGGDDELRGGLGTDTLRGGNGEDLLRGDEDNDSLDGENGDDVLKGGDVNDTLDGGPGADVLNGGPNALAGDTATYESRSEKVTVTIGSGTGDDGGASDGISGERDTVKGTIENLTGGDGNDVLTGSEVNNLFLGGPGADTINGLAGEDTMSYADHTAGVTVIIDSADNDGSSEDGILNARDLVKVDVENLIGSAFADSLKGSSIANVIEGGLGADQLFGVNGNDRLEAEDDLADTKLDCGGGVDSLNRDAGIDPAPIACESAFESPS